MNCPKNCGSELVWVDNGPRLQYHYCRTCKLELSELTKKLPLTDKVFDYSCMDDNCTECNPTIRIGSGDTYL